LVVLEQIGDAAALARAAVRRPARAGEEARFIWTLSLYPEAGEAGGCVRSLREGEGSGSGGGCDPERSAVEAARRARGMIRRYCAANRLNRLGTLTYAGEGCHEPAQLRRDVGGFFRRLRRALRGEAIPYLWVPEWHASGHGLHVHFAVGRYIGQPLIRETWGHGFVHIKLIGDLPVGSGSLEEARVSARYLAKYAGKAVGVQGSPGLHRYEVAQGFQPRSIYCDGATLEDVIGQASGFMGRAPSHVWHSSGEAGWDRPPMCWFAWSD
jgi:hypothetical protein